MKQSISLLLFSWLLTGCFKNTIRTDLQPSGPQRTEKANFFLWGLVGEHDVDLAQVCPGGVAEMHSEQTVGDCLLSCITTGIYAPLTVTVRCANGTAYLLEPDVDNAVTWVQEVDQEVN